MSVCLVRMLDLGVLERMERQTYDWRVRLAQRFPQATATNLGFVFISNDSITAVGRGLLGRKYGLLWPSHVYGRLVRELSNQGAKVAAFDILLPELRYDHAPVPVSTSRSPEIVPFLSALRPEEAPATMQQRGETYLLVDSDDFFAWQLNRTRRAVLAAEHNVLPHPLFATNAMAVADISADRDADGVLRRAKAFRDYRHWHPVFKQAEKDYGFDLNNSRIEPDRIVLLRSDGEEVQVAIDAENTFSLADFVGTNLPTGLAAGAKAFEVERVWHMGIVLAASELQLDLANAEVKLSEGRITFRGPGGLRRRLPVDPAGYFYINWELTAADRRLRQEAIENLLAQDLARLEETTEGLTNRWHGRLVVVGSSATGNNLTDRGATPLEQDTLLVSKHWNVANSIITDRFVRRTSTVTDCGLIVLLGVATAVLTWRMRVIWAAGSVLLLALGYCAVAVGLFVQTRQWLPLLWPVASAMFLHHGLLVTYRVVFEQRERRRLRSMFDKMLSPQVAREVLTMDTLALGGSRREITVLFADIRGFTALTDDTHEQAARTVAERQLCGPAAEAVFDEHAREALDTVNHYLSLVAEVVRQRDGTLDKYIGDCVMAYWGAPTPSRNHALQCVRAAIDAQRAILEFNRQREQENRVRQRDNTVRLKAGVRPLPLLPILNLGIGINSGVAIAGLMGSETHELSYTVFGREVNLASRLETISGQSRIIVGEATYQELLRAAPALAEACSELEATRPKGFQKPVKIYEVHWQATTHPERSAPPESTRRTV